MCSSSAPECYASFVLVLERSVEMADSTSFFSKLDKKSANKKH